MRYLPHSEDDIREMLEKIGAESIEELCCSVPKECIRKKPFKIAEPLTEWELESHIKNLSQKTASSDEYKVFAGAGSYEHYIPATASYLLSRSEFVTAYTPYQPEISQGTLQGIFEYQTLTAQLLGMEISNASLYDGSSALAEALLMAVRITGRKKVALSSAIHPGHRMVAKTYLKPANIEIIEMPYLKNGLTDISSASDSESFAAIAVQSPNFFGCIEDLKKIKESIKDTKTLFIVSFTEPLAYGLYKNPGTCGADIACGEGQSLGIPQSFGGPGLGMFAANKKYMRSIPGRLVGQTNDIDGKRGFVLTLSTREQHIRREKATSNICTNASLCALGASIYMASLGKRNFKKLARLNYDKTEYLKKTLKKEGVKIRFEAPGFNEFIADFGKEFSAKYNELKSKKIIAGIPIKQFYPELDGSYLLCVTETKTKEDLDILSKEITS